MNAMKVTVFVCSVWTVYGRLLLASRVLYGTCKEAKKCGIHSYI